MNDIRRLQHAIIDAFPDARTALSSPKNDSGYWHMHAWLGNCRLLAEWAAPFGFSLTLLDQSTHDGDYAEYPENLAEAIPVAFALLSMDGPASAYASDDAFREAFARTLASHVGSDA